MKRSNIKKTLDELNSISKMLKEAYVFDEEGADAMPQGGGEEPMEDEMMAQDRGVEQALEIINQIRELALDGISIFKEDVDNVYYITFKKLFLETDKAMSDKEEKEK